MKRFAKGALVRFLSVCWVNLKNALVYLFSRGRVTWHEGVWNRKRGRWSNWNRSFHSSPNLYASPQTEDEICRLVRSAKKVRVVGSGHSFNEACRTEGTLLSLDAYSKVLEIDSNRRLARFQAGIRLRDLCHELWKHGLALPVMGSTNSQSIGGLLATDLHGTGRVCGFLSEQVRSLRIVDAHGKARTVYPGDELFHAAMGGVGACGIVIEVGLSCVPAYQVEKSINIVKKSWMYENIDSLLKNNDHVSLYCFGGVNVSDCRVNVWNHTQKPSSPFLWLQSAVTELVDMLFSGFLFRLSHLLHCSRALINAGFFLYRSWLNNHASVAPASTGFSRQLFYQHDEIEYGIPYERFRECMEEVIGLLNEKKFMTLIEVRFTPNSSQGLLGPGVGRRTCYIELAPCLSENARPVFEETEKIFLKYRGQAHLGKFTLANPSVLKRMYRERFARFQMVRRVQDGQGKFLNGFVENLFVDRSLEIRKEVDKRKRVMIPVRAYRKKAHDLRIGKIAKRKIAKQDHA